MTVCRQLNGAAAMLIIVAAMATSLPSATRAQDGQGSGSGSGRSEDPDERWREGRRARYWREWAAQQAATRPTVPFSGSFSDDRVAITLNRANPNDLACTGTIILGDRDRPAKQLTLSGEIHDGELSGKFQDGNGNAFPFSAKMEDQNLIFRTGKAIYCLTDDNIPRPPGSGIMRWGPNMGGVGLYFEQTNDRQFVATMVRPGGASDRAGVRAGDVILKIDDIDLPSLELDAARRLVIGRIGTPVKLTVRHRNGQVEDYKLTRQRLQQMNVPPPRMIDADDNRTDQSDRPDRNDRGDRGDRGDRDDRGDRTDAPDRPR
jgi:hypothetical protein